LVYAVAKISRMSEEDILWRMPLSRAYAYEHISFMANPGLRLKPMLEKRGSGLLEAFDKLAKFKG
jgi:hypothetical protein